MILQIFEFLINGQNFHTSRHPYRYRFLRYRPCRKYPIWSISTVSAPVDIDHVVHKKIYLKKKLYCDFPSPSSRPIFSSTSSSDSTSIKKIKIHTVTFPLEFHTYKQLHSRSTNCNNTEKPNSIFVFFSGRHGRYRPYRLQSISTMSSRKKYI